MLGSRQSQLLCILMISLFCVASSTIIQNGNFSWSENIGWINWNPSEEPQATICPTVLSGLVWSENCGWINLGDGKPEDGLQYSNHSAEDFGVNHDSVGNLSGYAYGENIGWINFDGSSTGGETARVTIDLETGKLKGFAWGENVGWINFTDSNVVTDPTFLLMVSLDTNGDGEINSIDLIAHIENGSPCRDCRDWASDFAARWHED